MVSPASSDPGPLQPARRTRKKLPRAARLLRHAEFDRVYKMGRRHFSTSMTVFYLPRVTNAQAGSGFRIGFTVSRALGGAVDRNRMRRRLREAVRLCRASAEPPVDIVINPKKSLLHAEFMAVEQEVARAFSVIQQKVGSADSRRPKTDDQRPKADD